MKSCEATIIIPTTGNRGELLRYSVPSILNQTMQDFEILIVGDGVADESKGIIAELRRKDSRIFFHNFPKHERRGEPYRHQVIKGSRGKHIFYLTDRDLMLPKHLATMAGFLREHNFVTQPCIQVNRDQSLNIQHFLSFFGPGSQVDVGRRSAEIPLSCACHTRAIYDHLEFGWRTTPANEYTDRYMWKQFIAHPQCNMLSTPIATILWFGRGAHPGPPVEERVKELSFWSKVMATPEGIDNIWWTAVAGLLLERKELRDFASSVINGPSAKNS